MPGPHQEEAYHQRGDTSQLYRKAMQQPSHHKATKPKNAGQGIAPLQQHSACLRIKRADLLRDPLMRLYPAAASAALTIASRPSKWTEHLPSLVVVC